MMNKMVFCENCRKDVEYVEKEVAMEGTLKGEKYQYNGKSAYCGECDTDIYVAEIEDNNLKALYTAYRNKNSIISLEHIMEIPEKYGIGKRPLSLLLGWGEMTFSRYYDGYMPSRQYSDMLQHIYDDPAYYLSVLEKNRTNLGTEFAYEKSLRATNELIGRTNAPLTQLDIVIEYLLCRCEDITPLALQKALYYVQGFYYAFLNEFAFDDDCEAWAHGPVYPEIYNRYSAYRFDPIAGAETCDESAITDYQKAVIDSVIKNMCCYSGKVLESFTHSEQPWLKTRGDLPTAMNSNRIIDKSEIAEYFESVKERFEMMNPVDIELYSKRKFEQIN